MKTLSALIIAAALCLPVHALANSITIYDTQAEILQHRGDDVIVGVVLNLGNNGPTSNIQGIVRGLDNNGYELAHTMIRGKIYGQRNDSIKTRFNMRKLDYLRVDRWEVYDLVSYPAP